MLSTVHDDSMMTKTRRTRLVQGGLEDVLKLVMIEDGLWGESTRASPTTALFTGP